VGVKSREIDKPVDKEHSEQSVGGRIILKWSLKGQEGRLCTWERDKWWGVVKMAVNLRAA